MCIGLGGSVLNDIHSPEAVVAMPKCCHNHRLSDGAARTLNSSSAAAWLGMNMYVSSVFFTL